MKTTGYAAQSATTPLAPFEFERCAVGPNDVHIKVKYCGICHSDIHVAKDEWGVGNTAYPTVPGHEIVGVVESVGNKVTKFKAGDFAGVGCLVDSCQTCSHCNENDEPQCGKKVFTYNSKHHDGTVAQGGYSKDIVVKESFALKIPDNLGQSNLAATAPLLCAGITCYNPMKKWKMDAPGKKIGVIGLGGLGHMAVQIGVAFGNEVTVISTSLSKKEEALSVLKATNFIVSSDPQSVSKAVGTLDFIMDTVAAPKNMDLYLSLMKPNGVLVTVGLPPAGYKLEISPGSLVAYNKCIAGSLIGGIKPTQEMLDFCGAHNILSMIEKIDPTYINTAYERVLKSDVKYRFVIDVEKM